MAIHRLVRHIETHSRELAAELLTRARQSPHLTTFDSVPDQELKQRVYEVYSQLGQWLMSRTEEEIERQYSEIGARRYRQGVLLSELLWAIILTKDNLWDFLYRESWPGFEIEVIAEHDMFRLIDHFFNRAMYHAARGFERAERAQEALAAAAN
ncbi:MAG TPA: hypothetical protein VE263_08750 [Candidatus Angelobacter sp.]|nr:hypothetical protein [Candidatus Angelobacter sp.]